jgi:hypothetical protein
MAAHEHLNPEQVRAIAEAHGDKYFANYKDPVKRDRGCCSDYSDHFGVHGGLKGTKIKTYASDPDYAKWTHDINVVPTTQGPYALDFTYLQFDKTAKMPHFEPLHEYTARIKQKYPEAIDNPPDPPARSFIKDLYPDMNWEYKGPTNEHGNW